MSEPTDETTLERLHKEFFTLAHANEQKATKFAASKYPDVRQLAEGHRLAAAEARLIADALRCKLASLTAPAAQDTAEVLALLDGADGSGCGPDDTFTLYLPLHRARRLHALVTARIAHDEEARSAATLPRGGADS